MTSTNGRQRRLWLAAALALLTACESGTTMPDGGMDDAGPVDAATAPDAGPSDDGGAMAALVSIDVTPSTATLDVGGTQALTVTGTYDDGSTAAVTTGVAFRTADAAVATVDDAGVVTAVASGTTTVTATVGALSDGAEVTVSAPSRDGVVFDDEYGPNVMFAPFGGSTNDVAPTTTEAHEGTSSLRIAVPAGGYTGGALIVEAGSARDLTGFDAITFFARADAAHRLNVAGLGDNAAGDTTFKTEVAGGLDLTTTWTEFTIPLPNPAKLGSALGLFHFAEGSDEGAYSIFLDEIRFVRLPSGTVTNPRPAMATETVTRGLGATYAVAGTAVTYALGGRDLTLAPTGAAFFDFVSGTPAVATVDASGVVTAVAEGTSSITGSLAGVAAAGALTFQVVAPLGPTVPAPTPPTRNPADVIALFSDAYTEVGVDTFRTPWSDGRTVLTRATIMGNNVLSYENMLFAGIETTGANQINASAMTHLHMDIWVEGMAAAGQLFTIKLVDWGADGMYSPGVDDRDAELLWTPTGGPSGTRTLMTGRWMSLDIPLSAFDTAGSPDAGSGLTARAHLSQYILKSEIPVNMTTHLWVDNLYFYRATP